MEESRVIPASSVIPSRGVRWLMFAAGVLLVAIGTIGIVLPLLPSTVFFILATGCFARSSAAAHRWLTTNRLFGARLRDYRERRGATLQTKVFSLASLWLGIAFAVWMVDFRVWASVMLPAVAIAVSMHLVKLRTLSKAA